MQEFHLGGEIELTIDGPDTSEGRLSIDEEASYALLGTDSGYLRKVVIRTTGEAAHRALWRFLGHPAADRRSAEGSAEIEARHTCDPIEE